MARNVTLAASKYGINRLKNKGGASVKVFYDLVNARLNKAGGIGPRPGLVTDATLPAGTKGLFGYAGKRQVFASSAVTITDARYQLNILPHPTTPARTLARIHYAKVVLGRIFVVAEFDNGDIFYYWLRQPNAWAAATVYGYQQIVQPSTPNGFYYTATNTDTTTPLWAAGTEKTVGNYIQPTTYNGFRYEATAVAGSAPVRTSSAEPTWPTTDGATVIEYNYGGTAPPAPTTPPPTYPPEIDNEYGPWGPGADPNNPNVYIP